MKINLIMKNLKIFMADTPLAFLVVVLLEIFSVISIVITYGLVRNVFSEQEQEKYNSKLYSFEKSIGADGKQGTWDDIDSFKMNFDALTDELGTELSCAYCSGYITEDGYDVKSGFSYYPNAERFQEIKGAGIGAGYEEYAEGKKIVQVTDYDHNKAAGSRIVIDDTEYTVSKVVSSGNSAVTYYFNYTSIPENFRVSSVVLEFADIPSHEHVEKLNGLVYELFGFDSEIAEPDIPDLLVKQFGTTALGICAAVTLVIVFNCITVYMYVFEKRRKWLAVVKLCGCKNNECIAVFLGEAMLVTLICCTAGTLLSRLVIIPKLENYFKAFSTVYTAKSYFLLAAAFCLVSLIILFVTVRNYVSETVNEMRGEAV